MQIWSKEYSSYGATEFEHLTRREIEKQPKRQNIKIPQNILLFGHQKGQS